MDLAVVRVGQLRALLLWSDAGEAAGSHTETELPLVLTAGVRVAASGAGQPQLGCQALVPGRAVLLSREAPPHHPNPGQVVVVVPVSVALRHHNTEQQSILEGHDWNQRIILTKINLRHGVLNILFLMSRKFIDNTLIFISLQSFLIDLY